MSFKKKELHGRSPWSSVMLIYSKGVCHYYNRSILKVYEMHLKIALKFIFSAFFKNVAFD